MFINNRKRTVYTCGILALAALFLVTITATAEQSGPQPTIEKKVNLELKDTPATEAIDILFKNTDLSYVIGPGVSGTVTASIKDKTFSEALGLIMEGSGLTYKMIENAYLFVPKPKEEAILETSISSENVIPVGSGTQDNTTTEQAAAQESLVNNGNLAPGVDSYYGIYGQPDPYMPLTFGNIGFPRVYQLQNPVFMPQQLLPSAVRSFGLFNALQNRMINRSFSTPFSPYAPF